MVLSSGRARQHRDGANATVKSNLLLHADGRTCDLEIAVAEGNGIQPLNNSVDDFGVVIFAKGDALLKLETVNQEKNMTYTMLLGASFLYQHKRLELSKCFDKLPHLIFLHIGWDVDNTEFVRAVLDV